MLEYNVRMIKHKVGLLNLAEELGNVSRALKMIGLSRDTFCRYKAAIEQVGIESLFDRSRRQPNLKNRVDELTEQSVLTHDITCYFCESFFWISCSKNLQILATALPFKISNGFKNFPLIERRIVSSCLIWL